MGDDGRIQAVVAAADPNSRPILDWSVSPPSPTCAHSAEQGTIFGDQLLCKIDEKLVIVLQRDEYGYIGTPFFSVFLSVPPNKNTFSANWTPLDTAIVPFPYLASYSYPKSGLKRSGILTALSVFRVDTVEVCIALRFQR